MSKVRKAVIPAAGLGTRFLPATKAQPKEMLPVVDKPAIQYVVEEAVGAGIDDILIITGRSKRAIEDHFDRNHELEQDLIARGKVEEAEEIRRLGEMADIHYVRQGETLGLAHAVAMARKHVGDASFAVLLGDDFMITPDVLSSMIAAHERVGGTILALLEVAPEEIQHYGSVSYDPPEGDDPLVRVRSVVEKPKPADAPSNLAVIGRYVFGPEIFEAIDRVEPGVGGELQLTDAIGLQVADHPVHGWRFTEGRYDTGQKLEYLKATVELASRRPDLGPDFRRWLASYVASEGFTAGP